MAPELSPDTWAQIRYDYEHSERPIADICAEHGISDGTLRDRVRRWNWTRRRGPIPREGPPAAVRIEASPPAVASFETSIPAPSAQGGGEQSELAAHVASEHGAAAVESDAASIAPRLQTAVARVLPAIEATIAKLAAGPLRPREMEQTTRALGALTRTLHELNALLSQHAPRSAIDDDAIPENLDEFRDRLAQKIEAFLASRGEEEDAFTDARGDEGFDEEAPSGATAAERSRP
jgi:transposase-like protein